MESHEEVSKKDAIEAAQIYLQTMEKAEDANYTVLSMANTFVECIDAIITKNKMSSRGSIPKQKTVSW